MKSADELASRDPAFFKSKYNVDIFTLRNINDMNRIKTFIDTNRPLSVAIIGTGLIGLEVCENIKGPGIEVTLLEKLTQVTPGLDSDMAVYVQEHIEKNHIDTAENIPMPN